MYAYGGAKIGQGRENAKTYLREHPGSPALRLRRRCVRNTAFPADEAVAALAAGAAEEEAQDAAFTGADDAE